MQRSIQRAAFPELSKCTWVSFNPLTKAGHPRHPLYMKQDAQFVPFDIVGYASN